MILASLIEFADIFIPLNCFQFQHELSVIDNCYDEFGVQRESSKKLVCRDYIMLITKRGIEINIIYNIFGIT